MSGRNRATGRALVFYDEVAVPATVDLLRGELGPGFQLEALPRDDRDLELQLAARADLILAGWRAVPREVIQAAERLKGIHKLGAGVDKIDLQAAAERGIPVTTSVGGNAPQVAEHTIMLILAVLRQLPELHASMRRGEWRKNEMRPRLRRLAGRAVGIVGAGNIGRAVAGRLAGFGCDVAYADPHALEPDVEQRLGITRLPLDDLIRRSDVLTVHVPSTDATRGMLDAARLAALPPGAVLVNTSRGDVVDHAALIDSLCAGHLTGAGIDVYPDEPPSPSDPLLHVPGVVLTPHVAGSSHEGVQELGREARTVFEQLLDGGALQPTRTANRDGRGTDDAA